MTGNVICIEGSEKSLQRAKDLNLADHYGVVDATDAVAMYEKLMELNGPALKSGSCLRKHTLKEKTMVSMERSKIQELLEKMQA